MNRKLQRNPFLKGALQPKGTPARFNSLSLLYGGSLFRSSESPFTIYGLKDKHMQTPRWFQVQEPGDNSRESVLVIQIYLIYPDVLDHMLSP